MITVDAHCHAGTNWFEPVEMILHQMNLNGVQRAVLIQHGGNYDNRYLLECVQRFPGRFSAVVGVDPGQPDAPATLEGLAKEEGVVGLRLRPAERSPDPDPLALWRKAAELGLPVSCFAINADHIAAPEFRALVEEVPNCTIVLEHLAGIYRSVSPESATAPYTSYRAALTLATHSNLYIKFGGLGEFCTRSPRLVPQFGFAEVPPLIEMAYEAFGPRRMMWGSDFPPVGGREGYRNALQGTLEHPAFSSQEDREWVFGQTALAVWGLEGGT